MMLAKIRATLCQKRALLKSDPNRFLRRVSGVIHVGANSGQERHLYVHHGLRVLWIEPIPDVFETLTANIMGFPRQSAVQCLVTDRDEADYLFHIANNNGASSSILDLNLHRDIWPEVTYESTITLRSMTLASLLRRVRIDPREYDALILDTQGSELLVLKGAVPILECFKYIKTEVPDFEAYVGCSQLTDMTTFLTDCGYREYSRHKFAERAQGGSYYDVVYQRVRRLA